MAIVDITIIPIGTETTSVSDYVAEIQKVLKSYQEEKGIEFQLTPMSTIIEGELPVLFETVQALHEVVFNKGIMRIATNIRIDDRRDKKSNMKSKLDSVYNKM
ncbi:MTH1187 family thiamine-binding protein [Peribacillus alkalitolerans]|uniref:MTH1187 family thiamine-binding protein n=1 Tax=Peribacillus alkalitolerans TaxID=1550385 RepID=UPI0013CFCB3F|nr:MTH1187 family thiamine-binding protein [Peribacillus alkalitolerans]